MLVANLRLAAYGWRNDPIRMTSQVAASFVIGQAIFWKIGYDQVGVGMKPKKQFGLGQKVSDWAIDNLSHDLQTAIALKVVEVLTDLGKAPLEAACYRRHGLTPDAVACLFTQPAWSIAEALEKAVSAAIYPRRLTEPEQIGLSAACIYGSLFRYIQSGILLLIGIKVNRLVARPIEAALRELLGK